MKKFIGYILLTLILVSCGAKSGHFRIEGRFRNLNQGEFYVYSPDGGIVGLDTIKVMDGRFVYETPLDDKATFIIIFPNFSEQAVFGESGKTAEIKGDASHLREMEIKGTDDNEKMTEFRMRVNSMTPPEAVKSAADFIKQNPTSLISIYLLKKYFIDTPQPNYQKAWELTEVMKKADGKNISINTLNKELAYLKASGINGKIPSFSAVNTEGKRVTNKNMSAQVNVITSWATWNQESQNIQRDLKRLKQKHGDKLSLLSVCVDANKTALRRIYGNDSTEWNNICSGKMWDTPILKTLGIATVPGNIIFDSKGKIIAKNLSSDKFKEKLEELLK